MHQKTNSVSDAEIPANYLNGRPTIKACPLRFLQNWRPIPLALECSEVPPSALVDTFEEVAEHRFYLSL